MCFKLLVGIGVHVASIYNIMRVLLIAIQVAVVRVLLWQIRYNMDRKGFLISDVSLEKGSRIVYTVLALS